MSTQYTHGRFVWRELMTPDQNRAKTFYSELFGWRTESVDMGPSGTYVLCYAGETQVGGIWSTPKDMQAPPMWTSYVSVTDVDAATETAKKNGGQVFMPPSDIPNIGRFSIIADPDNAVIALFKSAKGDQPPAQPKVGEFCWETLVTKDVAKAGDFYGKVTGWKMVTGMGMPTFAVDDSQQGMVADVQVAKNSPPMWATYVVVPKLEPSRERAEKLGAKILEPLIEVPGVGRISFIQDPTGAAIGLFEPGPRQ